MPTVTSLSNSFVSPQLEMGTIGSTLEEVFGGGQVPVSANMAALCTVLQSLEYQKTLTYKDSWKKRGELVSIFGNLARKWDRLEDMLLNNSAPQKSETKIDTVADLAVYCIKYLGWLAEQDPDGFRRWVQSVKDLEDREESK